MTIPYLENQYHREKEAVQRKRTSGSGVLERVLWGFVVFNVTFAAVAAFVYREELSRHQLEAASAQTAELPLSRDIPERQPAHRPPPTLIKLKTDTKKYPRPLMRQADLDQLSSADQDTDETGPSVEPPATSTPVSDSESLEEPTAATPPEPALGRLKQPSPDYPAYELLHFALVGSDQRRYAEILVPSLSYRTPTRELRRISKGLAELENLDSLVLYCTREAHRAHYSMEYSDQHPDALRQGLLCFINRGWFKKAGRKDWGLIER